MPTETTLSVSSETRDLVAGLKRGGETYDDVVRLLVEDHEREPLASPRSREVAE